MIAPRSNTISTRSALLSMVTIVALVLMKALATPLYQTRVGLFPAMMVEVMASRSIFFNWSPAGYYEELFDQRQAQRQKLLFGSGTFIPDAYRLRRFKPDLAKVTDWNTTYDPVNRFGYLGPDWSLDKKAGTRRIAVLGDSIPEGYGMNMNQGFVYLLTDRLNEAAAQQGLPQRFESLNFSVSAYHLTQMMDVALQDVPQFHPDVYMVMLTELSVYRSWDTHLVYLEESGVDLKYDFLRQVARRANAQQSDAEAVLHAKLAPFRITVIRQALSQMRAKAEQDHARFIVVLVPGVEDADISQRRFDGIPRLLSSMHITFIDISDTFAPMVDRNPIRLTETDIHPNPRGHEMICDNLYKKLRANPDAWSKLVGSSSGAERYPESPR